jgi:tRNA U34 5-carboxymethylaminomethyl modifying GTPase MnmE/TrmE
LEHFDVSELCAKFLRDSLYDLDALYGRHDDEKKLGFIFKNFCIGK